MDMFSTKPLLSQTGEQLLRLRTVLAFEGEAAQSTLDKVDFSFTTCPLLISYERAAFDRLVSFLTCRPIQSPPSAPREPMKLELREPSQLALRMKIGEIVLVLAAPESNSFTHDIRIVKRF